MIMSVSTLASGKGAATPVTTRKGFIRCPAKSRLDTAKCTVSLNPDASNLESTHNRRTSRGPDMSTACELRCAEARRKRSGLRRHFQRDQEPRHHVVRGD